MEDVQMGEVINEEHEYQSMEGTIDHPTAQDHPRVRADENLEDDYLDTFKNDVRQHLDFDLF